MPASCCGVTPEFAPLLRMMQQRETSLLTNQS